MVDTFSISRLTLIIAAAGLVFIFGCGDNEVTVTPLQQLTLQKTPSPSFTHQDNYLFNPEAEAGEGNEITYWDKETTDSKYDMEDGNDWKFFDVTEMIRDQQSSAREKHGVIIHFDKEDLKSRWSCYRFVSKEASKSWLPRYPKLLIVNKEVN